MNVRHFDYWVDRFGSVYSHVGDIGDCSPDGGHGSRRRHEDSRKIERISKTEEPDSPSYCVVTWPPWVVLRGGLLLKTST